MALKHTENFFVRTLLSKVKLSEIMVEDVIALNVNDPFSRVEELMREKHIRHIPIVDEHFKLAGIITQRDLYRIQPPRKDEEGNWFYDKEMLDKNILRHVMTKNPFTLSPENTVAEALLAMVDRKYGCIPIVDKSQTLCGIVTQIDILRIGAQIIREGKT
ncbi:MAG TPA: CBS domain-containing protein [Candidatus Omnitrophota bacterium]|nr:CBS domain-containing protein [Candidatus Omnitrophota bacterium]HPD83928.1 CBS domain-containing protein [Candidatus Omnitrophota bacterium]HRZ02785.1 CBS domain-containing protein [Candidatus Omnitrophota bacterium]